MLGSLVLIYTVLLFATYQLMFMLTGYSVNTAVYGLFAILLFFYHLTDNLDFSKKYRCHSIYINIIIFMIFLFFYKDISIFVVFLVFSLVQMLLYRVFKRIYRKKPLYLYTKNQLLGDGKIL